MKNLTPSTETISKQNYGTEPIVLVKLELSNSLWYGDKITTINGIDWNGKILSVGTFRSEKTKDNTGLVQSISLTLEDGDLFLKNLITSERLINKIARVYHVFQGQSEADFIEILVGEISTPLKWAEKERTLSFDIVGKITSKEIGCLIPKDLESTLLGDQVVSDDAFNKALPIVFGTVENIPTIKLTKPIEGVLLTPISRKQPYTSGYPLDQNYVEIKDGNLFPQNQLITIYIDGVPVTGQMIGTKFTIQEIAPSEGFVTVDRYDGRFIYIQHDCKSLVGKCLFAKQVQSLPPHAENGVYKDTYLVLNREYKILGQTKISDTQEKLYLDQAVFYTVFLEPDIPHIVPVANPSPATSRLSLFPPQDNKLEIRSCLKDDIKACSKVTYGNGDIYAFACGQVEKVYDVRAYKNDCECVASLPECAYEVKEYTVNGEIISTIRLLDEFKNIETNWKVDTLYVSVKSPLSNNTADVLSYLLRNFTNAEIDTDSFNKVRDLLDKYPSNFALVKNGDAFEICNEIAWQARCALFTSGLKVKLVYLSKEPEDSESFTDNEIEEATPELSLTNSEDIVTDLSAKYKLGICDTEDTIRHYKNNVDIYGLKSQEKEFYIYDQESLILKTLEFWGKRYSNQWFKLLFKGFLTKIGAEVFDAYQIDSTILSAKCVVDNIDYDSLAISMQFEFWTPIIAGTNTPSSDAWLSDASDIKPDDPVISKITVDDSVKTIEDGKIVTESVPVLAILQHDYHRAAAEVSFVSNGPIQPDITTDPFVNTQEVSGTEFAAKTDTEPIEPGTIVTVKKVNGISYIQPTGKKQLACICATDGNFDFTDSEIDAIESIEYTDKRILIWQQDNPVDNGIWRFNGIDFFKEKVFATSDIGLIIGVADGITYGKTSFVVTGVNTVEIMNPANITVRVATYRDTVLSGLQVVDTIQLEDGDKVLVRGQFDTTQIGIYFAKADAWVRAGTLNVGTMVSVTEGLLQAGAVFVFSDQADFLQT